MMEIIEVVIVLLGLVITPILFYRFPRLPKRKSDIGYLPKVSVIVPARNEERNISLLLDDLQNQTIKPHEIICIDDDSSDDTAQIAMSYMVRVVSLHDKPDGWTGKTWACLNGANVSNGEVLLFMDADVRLGPEALEILIQGYLEAGCTISVQPYHITLKAYEQFSMLFNLIQIAANGITLPKPLTIGLYGPIILISKSDYFKIKGHECVKKSIIEDVALGNCLKDNNIDYRLFIGDSTISYRMYSGGLKSLFQGWTKNIASGALKTPMFLFFMVFLWITSMTSVPLHIVIYALSKDIPFPALYFLLYIIWVVVLFILSRKAGKFRLTGIVFYPVLLIMFIYIFFVSVFKKLFGIKVIWKDRAITKEND